MGIRKYKPTTPGRRGSSVADFVEVTRSEPEKSLVRPLAKKGGRNNSGKITTRHQGGGHKRAYRVIDFKRADKDGVPATVAHIARDPLDPLFDDAAFVKRLRSRRTGLKRALLDQTLVSGIGNIYADESLWRARLHWAQPTDELAPARAREVLGHARDVMSEALGQGGTSFDALYVNVNGESGYFDVSLAAYGQADRPCPRCGRPIVREPFMNRSSFRCPRCQRPPTPGSVRR